MSLVRLIFLMHFQTAMRIFPKDNNMKKLILLLLNIYKKTVSPLMIMLFGHACRYYPENPSCGDYTIKAIEKHGVVKGGKQSIIRIVHCSPWTQSTKPEILDIDY